MKSVSLVIVDCIAPESALNTLMRCGEGLDFGEKLFSRAKFLMSVI